MRYWWSVMMVAIHSTIRTWMWSRANCRSSELSDSQGWQYEVSCSVPRISTGIGGTAASVAAGSAQVGWMIGPKRKLIKRKPRCRTGEHRITIPSHRIWEESEEKAATKEGWQ